MCCPGAGEELTISYGDKGNEELLLLYGFAQPANPHETLMLLCPLPSPEDWDEVFTARMELLQVIAGVFYVDVETASKIVAASSCSAVPIGRQVLILCGSVHKPCKSNSSTCIGVLISAVCLCVMLYIATHYKACRTGDIQHHVPYHVFVLGFVRPRVCGRSCSCQPATWR